MQHNFPKEPLMQGPPKTRGQKHDELIVNIGSMMIIPVGALLGFLLFYVLPHLLVGE